MAEDVAGDVGSSLTTKSPTELWTGVARNSSTEPLPGFRRRSDGITECSSWARSGKSSGTTPMLPGKTKGEERGGEEKRGGPGSHQRIGSEAGLLAQSVPAALGHRLTSH